SRSVAKGTAMFASEITYTPTPYASGPYSCAIRGVATTTSNWDTILAPSMYATPRPAWPALKLRRQMPRIKSPAKAGPTVRTATGATRAKPPVSQTNIATQRSLSAPSALRQQHGVDVNSQRPQTLRLKNYIGG